MDNINESLDYLEELVRKAYSLIAPYTYQDNLKWLLNQDFRKKLFEKHPRCVLPIKTGRLVPFLPVCNRMGIHDPAIIQFSMKVAEKLVGNSNVDQEHLMVIIQKLKNLNSKYSKDVPKPGNAAYRKGRTTVLFNRIKQYLDDHGLRKR